MNTEDLRRLVPARCGSDAAEKGIFSLGEWAQNREDVASVGTGRGRYVLGAGNSVWELWGWEHVMEWKEGRRARDPGDGRGEKNVEVKLQESATAIVAIS